jgi:hypothetical protein
MRQVIRSLFVPSRSLRGAAAAVAVALVGLPACSSQSLDGQSGSYIIIDSINAARGNEPDEESGVLDSDVQTCGSVFQDIGRLRLRLGLKDPGNPSNPIEPTPTQFITVTRYHVKYVRSDNRNSQGVDIPFEFDGGSTATIIPGGSDLVITLVRANSKLEAPLRGLRDLGGQVVIGVIAEVTIYGKDQGGREVSAKGAISVTFADFGDASCG